MQIRRLLLALTLFLAAALPQRSLAAISLAGGGYLQGENGSAAAIVSSGAAIPVVPLEVQGSLMLPFTGQGGYAATAEIRGFTGGGYGGAYVGVGAGVGTLSTDRSSGTVFTFLAGKSIAPLTSFEIRVYKQTNASGETGAFIGLRFSL